MVLFTDFALEASCLENMNRLEVNKYADLLVHAESLFLH